MSLDPQQRNIIKKSRKYINNLKESNELLRSIFDTQLIGMCVLEAKRGESGELVDFQIQFLNKELEMLTKRTDLVGKLYGQEFPGIKQMGLYDLMVKTLETGKSHRMEYKYPHDGFDKWFSSMFVKLGDGLIASNLDITDRKQIELDKLTLIAEQNQKIFWATLSAQEEERKRIAETLHNGLGQLLYGVKLSLGQLDLEKELLDMESLRKIKSDTMGLLTKAIEQSRSISHELTPVILEDFGLKEAISEICKEISPLYKTECYIKGFKYKLSKHVELAIYRILQELVTNVIKHADATEIKINVEINSKVVDIRVTDNGIGFTGDMERTGIGLTIIKNKLKLLNGSLKLAYNKEGTVVDIVLPYKTAVA
jgi:two-component system NarL family sensor kinase